VKRGTIPTWTSRVEALFRKTDDFLSTADIKREIPDISLNQLGAAIHHLQKHGLLESVQGPKGCLHWFWTGAPDPRTRTIEERRPEDKPRRTRQTGMKEVPNA
jgi:hypothetical protein